MHPDQLKDRDMYHYTFKTFAEARAFMGLQRGDCRLRSAADGFTVFFRPVRRHA